MRVVVYTFNMREDLLNAAATDHRYYRLITCGSLTGQEGINPENTSIYSASFFTCFELILRFLKGVYPPEYSDPA